MSTLSKKDLHTPFTSATIEKILGVIQRKTHNQEVAASLAAASLGPADHAGKPRSVFVALADLPGAGESMTYDVKADGVSVLSAPFVLNAASATSKLVEFPLSANGQIALGAVVTVDRVYVAGAGLMTENAVGVEWA